MELSSLDKNTKIQYIKQWIKSSFHHINWDENFKNNLCNKIEEYNLKHSFYIEFDIVFKCNCNYIRKFYTYILDKEFSCRDHYNNDNIINITLKNFPDYLIYLYDNNNNNNNNSIIVRELTKNYTLTNIFCNFGMIYCLYNIN
jgi:hypothetical protein